MLLVILRAEVPARQQQDHGIDTLQFTEPSPSLGVIGQLVIREYGAWNNVVTHGTLL